MNKSLGPLPIAAWAGAVILLAGCGSSLGGSTTYLPEPAALQPAAICSTTLPEPAGAQATAPSKGRVPEDFVPVDVVRCTPDFAAGTVSEDHLSGEYSPLLEALAVPSERGGARSCLDYADVPPELWLVNANSQAINVTWPLDNCEHLKPATAKALEALTLRESRTVSQTDSAS